MVLSSRRPIVASWNAVLVCLARFDPMSQNAPWDACASSCSHRVLLSSVLLSGRPHPLVALPRGSLYTLVADAVLVVFRSLLSSALLVRWFGCSLAHPLPALFSSVLPSPS